MVIFELVFGTIHGRPYEEGFQKIPHTPVPVTLHWN
jgi:hypothetical protein